MTLDFPTVLQLVLLPVTFYLLYLVLVKDVL